MPYVQYYGEEVRRSRFQFISKNIHIRKGKWTFTQSFSFLDVFIPDFLGANVKMASHIITSLLIVYIVTGSLLRLGDARNTYVCKPCKTIKDCEQEPNDFCVWDEVRDNCGRRTCARGPGERCGGPLDIYGKCGEGLMCKQDEKCHGCMLSPTDYNCFP